eukprot:gene6608-13376_t
MELEKTGLEDSEEEDYDDEDEDQEELQNRSNRRRPRDDEDDEDDDDDDDDSEEEKDADAETNNAKPQKAQKKVLADTKKSRSKRQKNHGISSFFLTEAAEDAGEDEYEEDEPLEYEKREVSYDVAEEEAIERLRRRQESTKQMYDKSVEEIAAEVEARHRSQGRSRTRHGTNGTDYEIEESSEQYYTNEVSQQANLPGVTDPGIWMVRCKDGFETSLVRSIMLKIINAKSKGSPIRIKSAFCTSKGYVYIEAMTEPYARAVVDGLHSLYSSTFTRVPVKSMTSLLSVQVTRKPLQIGQLVRMKRGPYKGDLVKVVDVYDGGSRALVHGMPRVDIQNIDENKRGKRDILAARPSQKLFNAEDARAAGLDIIRKKLPSTGEYCDFWNNEYYKDGYFYKDVTVATYLDCNGKKPTLDELSLFREKKDRNNDSNNDNEDNNDLNAESTTSTSANLMRELAAGISTDILLNTNKKVLAFSIGDLVQVVNGELRNLIGSVITVDDVSQLVKIQPINNITKVEVQVEASLLVKYIRPGAHVKVVGGSYSGQTGRVVSVNVVDGDHIAAVLTDGVQTEITCNVSHLQVGWLD